MWPGKPTYWIRQNTLYISIPFTWNLPEIHNSHFLQERVIVGGPAVKLMPWFFDDRPDIDVQHDYPGAMQIVNPVATKTTTGCIRKCGFCAVPRTEGKIVQLPDWPDLPEITDNNLLAASVSHFDRVIDRLVVHGHADFNQGLDSRLLTTYHAERIAEIKKPLVRLALDNMAYADQWEQAFGCLRSAGIAKHNIRSYALIGFNSGPDEAWNRCSFIENHGIKALPMWYHELYALKQNEVTDEQKFFGWSDYDRRRIMQWYYKHKEAVAP